MIAEAIADHIPDSWKPGQIGFAKIRAAESLGTSVAGPGKVAGLLVCGVSFRQTL
jgi:hypothetical protein